MAGFIIVQSLARANKVLARQKLAQQAQKVTHKAPVKRAKPKSPRKNQTPPRAVKPKLEEYDFHTVVDISHLVTTRPDGQMTLMYESNGNRLRYRCYSEEALTLFVNKIKAAGDKIIPPDGALVDKVQESTAKPIEPAPLEKPKPRPRALLSHDSLRERFIKQCRKDGIHWRWQGWNHGTPHFTVDGKPLPVRDAGYILFIGPIPENTSPAVKCAIFDCVAPGCLTALDNMIAKELKQPTQAELHEIKRLTVLKKTPQEIVEILKNRLDPKTVYRAVNGFAYARGR